MKTTNIYIKYINGFINFLVKIPKAIVSAIPTQKIDLKPGKSSEVFIEEEELMDDYDRH